MHIYYNYKKISINNVFKELNANCLEWDYYSSLSLCLAAKSYASRSILKPCSVAEIIGTLVTPNTVI
jgi:hypothetical protein